MVIKFCVNHRRIRFQLTEYPVELIHRHATLIRTGLLSQIVVNVLQFADNSPFTILPRYLQIYVIICKNYK